MLNLHDKYHHANMLNVNKSDREQRGLSSVALLRPDICPIYW